MDSNESTEDLIRKVMYYVINYEVESGRFPDSNWWTVDLVSGYYIEHPSEIFYGSEQHPEFYSWVSILANRRVNLRNIQKAIYTIMNAFRSNDLSEIQKKIRETREQIDFLNRHVLYQQPEDENEYVPISVANILHLEQEKIYYNQLLIQLRQLEKIENKIKIQVEKLIEKLSHKVGQDSIRLIGHMVGLEEYKMEPYLSQDDRFEQQLLAHISDLVIQGIGYEQFVYNPQLDPVAYQLFEYIRHDPERVQRIYSAFQKKDSLN